MGFLGFGSSSFTTSEITFSPFTINSQFSVRKKSDGHRYDTFYTTKKDVEYVLAHQDEYDFVGDQLKSLYMIKGAYEAEEKFMKEKPNNKTKENSRNRIK